MRTKYSRVIAVVMAVTAGGLAALALRPAPSSSTATLAARNPAVEVRTQVIRRTIHVIRHEPGARLRGSRGSPAVVVAGHGRARTAASGGHRSAHGAGTAPTTGVATRASGTHASAGTSSQRSSSAAPVATRSSGSHTTAGSSAPAGQSHPVSTRTSGAHGSTSGGSAGSSGHPVTRASGGGHGEDGGDGGGGDN